MERYRFVGASASNCDEMWALDDRVQVEECMSKMVYANRLKIISGSSCHSSALTHI